eukprot:1293371-Prymnesium_polylepis.1
MDATVGVGIALKRVHRKRPTTAGERPGASRSHRPVEEEDPAKDAKSELYRDARGPWLSSRSGRWRDDDLRHTSTAQKRLAMPGQKGRAEHWQTAALTADGAPGSTFEPPSSDRAEATPWSSSPSGKWGAKPAWVASGSEKWTCGAAHT